MPLVMGINGSGADAKVPVCRFGPVSNVCGRRSRGLFKLVARVHTPAEGHCAGGSVQLALQLSH